MKPVLVFACFNFASNYTQKPSTYAAMSAVLCMVVVHWLVCQMLRLSSLVLRGLATTIDGLSGS